MLSCALGLAGLSSCARPAPEPVTPLRSLSFPPLDDSAGKWAPILSSPITSYDVSLDGVERPTPTTLALWVRTVYKGNNNMLALGVAGAVTREEFDCARRRMRTRASSIYDRDSTTVTSKTYARSLWFTPRRGSNYAYLLSAVCAQLARESSADVPGTYRFAVSRLDHRRVVQHVGSSANQMATRRKERPPTYRPPPMLSWLLLRAGR